MAYTSEIEKLERRWNENPLGLTFAPLAEAHRKAGDHTRALELLEIGLAQHPNYVPAHIVRGRCHIDTNAVDAAELAFLRVIELDAENAIALRSLADICERTGRVSEAVRRLEALIEVDRSNEEARHQLHRLRTESAIPTAEAAVAAPAEELVPPPIQPSAPAGPGEPEPAQDSAEAAGSVPAQDELNDIAVYDTDDLEPDSAGEFQLPSDAEALSASGDRLPDVVLGSEITEQSLPTEYDASGEGMIGAPSPAAAGAVQLPGTETAQEPVLPEAGSALDETFETDALPDHAASATSWAGSIFEPAPEPDRTESPSLLEEADYLAESHEFAAPIESALDQPPIDESAALTAAEESFVQEPASSETDAILEPVVPPAAAAEPEPVMAAEPEPVWPEPEPEPVTAAEPEPEQAEPEQAEPEPVAAADATTPGAWWASAAVDAAVAESEEPSAGAETEAETAASGPEPALVVTESMAEVFLRQGHPELALAVYTQLAQRDPENRRVADAMTRLREDLAPPAPAPSPLPRYDAASTGGISVAFRLGELLGAPRPPVAATVHPPVFEPPPRAAEPTRVADESLSLSSVFGEEAGAPVGPASAPAESVEGEPSFDEFFAPHSAAELPSTPAQPEEAAGAPAQSGEDLERFNAWLRGLKG